MTAKQVLMRRVQRAEATTIRLYSEACEALGWLPDPKAHPWESVVAEVKRLKEAEGNGPPDSSGEG